MDIHMIDAVCKCLWQTAATCRAIYLLFFKKDPTSNDTEKGFMWLAISAAC